MLSWLRQQLLVMLVLFASLGATLALWMHEKNNAELDSRARLDTSVRDVTSRIEQRIAAYEQVLRGAQGLQAATPALLRKDFSTYIHSLQLGADYAGIEGVGIARLLAADQLTRYVQQVQQQGLNQFHVWPEGARPWYAPVLQLEPAIGTNLLMTGLDLWADPVYRPAMERARDAGLMAISGKIKLPSVDNVRIRTGFVMFLPIYRSGSNIIDASKDMLQNELKPELKPELKNAAQNTAVTQENAGLPIPLDTLAARRAGIVGWVFAPFSLVDLLAGLYGENNPAADVKIYDGVDINDEHLIYDSAGQSAVAGASSGVPAAAIGRFKRRLQATEYVVNGGSNWTIVMTALPGFEMNPGKDKSIIILFAGLMLSVSFAALTWLLVSGRERALVLAREMTRELRASEARFRYLAQYDELSGLPNRAMFKDRLQQAIVQAKRDKTRLALMYLDLDKFKPINDQLGHHVGDLLLRAVAEKMLSCVRESDTVARIGGDEFMILLPLIEQDQDALLVAEKIRHLLCQPFEVAAGHILQVSCSIGIAIYPEHGETDTELCRRADKAMYQAKDGGRNRITLFGAG